MKRGICRPQVNISVQNSKQNIAWMGWKQEVSQLSACHLAVSLSRACYHTSYERGHSGLPADVKIRTIVQLIGILWSYIGVHLGSANIPFYFARHSATSLHILGYHIRWKGTSIALIWGIVGLYTRYGRVKVRLEAYFCNHLVQIMLPCFI